MVKKLIKRWVLFTVIAAVGTFLVIVIGICHGNNRAEDTNEAEQKANVSQPAQKPIIIWYHNISRDTPAATEIALSSGLVSHVMIKSMHRKDYDKEWRKMPKVVKAIEVVKRYKAKLIWNQSLWPLYGIEQSSKEDLFDPNYYIKEIQTFRSEGLTLGADFVAVDTEPYGYSPIKKYLKGGGKLTREQTERLKNVIKQVVKTVGTVDFVLPAGSMNESHPYNILSELGRYGIAENTYFSNLKVIKKIKYPYEIFGAYINTVPDRPGHPYSPYFTIQEIFEKSHLWSDKKGLFLYPKEHHALAVAKELLAYSKSLPDVNSVETTN